MTTLALSLNAEKLLQAVKSSNLWETEAITVLFPKPSYVGTMDPNYTTEEKINIQTAFWQWEENLYGNGSTRPVNGTSVNFEMNVSESYADTTMKAVKELKKAGLIVAKNAGYNTYYYTLKS
jgi:hypothetical protein